MKKIPNMVLQRTLGALTPAPVDAYPGPQRSRALAFC
jgi:hypothetical protein